MIRQLGRRHGFRLQPGHRAIATATTVLAIETSCDDTSVAVIQATNPRRHLCRGGGLFDCAVNVIFHDKITANTAAYAGIHPLVALASHHAHLGPLAQKALAALKTSSPLPQSAPDLIAVTRGPGMRSNLSVGLEVAKGLALAYQVPLIGVHHMQAHALTPRLLAPMSNASSFQPARTTVQPDFPFITVLVSGGHTTLLDSKGLTDHQILAQTQDIALGDCLDKAARTILPAELLKPPYGKALEDFAFPNGLTDYTYSPPMDRHAELKAKPTRWNWSLTPPLSVSKSRCAKAPDRMMYSFVGLLTSAERFIVHATDNRGHAILNTTRPSASVSMEERRDMAREVQRVAFEHLASRILLHLDRNFLHSDSHSCVPQDLVVSGGVASNQYLRHVLRCMLDSRGYSSLRLTFPPRELCTDNALMIAWAGLEMFCAGYTSSLGIAPIRKWSMDPHADDGGILGVEGWLQNQEGLSASISCETSAKTGFSPSGDAAAPRR